MFSLWQVYFSSFLDYELYVMHNFVMVQYKKKYIGTVIKFQSVIICDSQMQGSCFICVNI